MIDVAYAAAVNDRRVLEQCLKRSPDLGRSPYPLIEAEGFASAAAALNYAIDTAMSRYLVFVHQDVYIPDGWEDKLAANIELLQANNISWAVLGVFGAGLDGVTAGRVWSTDVMKEYGEQCDGPQAVATLDECLLVLDRHSDLRFDPNLPHFHLYATDLILQGHLGNRQSFAICAPIVHHSLPVKTLTGGYTEAYRYMQKKWQDRLPWPTLIVPLTRGSWALWRGELRRKRARVSRFIKGWVDRRGTRCRDELDPKLLAALAGYEASSGCDEQLQSRHVIVAPGGRRPGI